MIMMMMNMSKLSLWIQNLCTDNKFNIKEKKTPTKIKQVSIKNKNTVAKFSKETQATIMLRDKQCIWCGKPWSDFHHIYFWTQAMYTEDRNDSKYGCFLCRDCHNEAHGCEQWQWLREQFINYLFIKK